MRDENFPTNSEVFYAANTSRVSNLEKFYFSEFQFQLNTSLNSNLNSCLTIDAYHNYKLNIEPCREHNGRGSSIKVQFNLISLDSLYI